MTGELIFQGLMLTLAPKVLFSILLGTLSGIMVGALPGLSSTLGVALLLPFTFGLDTPSAFGLLGGMYCSSIYGGSISAILINTPGTPAAAATVLDGFPMTQKGESGRALNMAIISSFVGGVFSTLALLLIAPLLARVGLKFGPPETFMISVFGMTIVGSVSGKSMVKGIIAALIGLFISIIGIDPILGYKRFTFGRLELYSGINIIIVLVGVFSIPEALSIILDRNRVSAEKLNITNNKISRAEIIRMIPTWIRGSIIGTLVGIIPGIGTPVACFTAYNEEKRASKHPEKFGTGILEGVAAPESANNAVEGGSFVPLLTLGIPGSGQTAIYLGAMAIHGIMPGASLFSGEKGPIAYSIIMGLFIANVFMLGVGLSMVRLFVKLLGIKKDLMVPLIITFAIIGSYSINNRIFDVMLMLGVGVAGYFLKKAQLPLAPVVLASILGPIGESALVASKSMFRGNYLMFFTRPICLIIIAVTVLSLYYTVRAQKKIGATEN